MKKYNKKYQGFSEPHISYLKSIKKDKITTIIYRLLILISIVFLWEIFARTGVVDAFFVSSPSRMIKAFVSIWQSGELFYHIGITLYETVVGFILATALGFFIAIILWWSTKLINILEPYIVVLNSLPKIALGPLIIIWVGAGTSAIIVMCILICVVITTLTMLTAFINCDKDKIALMKSMNANKFQILTKLIIPNARIEFVSVLKINVGMSWVGTIMGEYLVSKAGLGYLIVYGGQVFKLDLVMASTVILCLLACGMYALVGLIENRFKK